MGSKANDSRMGTIGLPDSSGISLRLTPAPEAVINTSWAPTRMGMAVALSAAPRLAAAPARTTRRRSTRLIGFPPCRDRDRCTNGTGPSLMVGYTQDRTRAEGGLHGWRGGVLHRREVDEQGRDRFRAVVAGSIERVRRDVPRRAR